MCVCSSWVPSWTWLTLLPAWGSLSYLHLVTKFRWSAVLWIASHVGIQWMVPSKWSCDLFNFINNHFRYINFNRLLCHKVTPFPSLVCSTLCIISHLHTVSAVWPAFKQFTELDIQIILQTFIVSSWKFKVSILLWSNTFPIFSFRD
jgi:hypothetical protein